MKVAVDRYMTHTPTANTLWIARHLSDNPMTGITQCAALYFGALLVSYGLEFLQTYMMQWTGQRIMFDMRSQIFAKALPMPMVLGIKKRFELLKTQPQLREKLIAVIAALAACSSPERLCSDACAACSDGACWNWPAR